MIPIGNIMHSGSWAEMIAVLHIAICIPTTIHVLLHKDDERAAIGWIGLIVLSPFLGSALYWIFGINRVQRRAKKHLPQGNKDTLFPVGVSTIHDAFAKKLRSLMQMGYAIHKAEYLDGNSVTPLINGDEAYPRMLKAISEAKESVILSSYIFDYDKSGRKFVEALGDAHKRGIAVYVLIDGYLLGYRWRRTDWALRKQGVTTTRYLPFLPRFINLRNHRKILSVDGSIAFIGGMNISQSNMLSESPLSPVQDIHFEVMGPVINQINHVFIDDWLFAKNERLELPRWIGAPAGTVVSRVLPDGPDENHQKLAWTLLGAINSAQNHIRIMTPYFLPDITLMNALKAASLRGVIVDILLPEKSDIYFFNWAMIANFQDMQKFGIKIYISPPPFVHSKVFLIDDFWSFIGSANWDERSLALNFEISLECYDEGMNRDLSWIFDTRKNAAKPLSCSTYQAYPLVLRVRNNLFRLFLPYL
jgi:cardiolipin synthase